MKIIIITSVVLVLMTVVLGVVAIFKEMEGTTLKRYLGFNGLSFLGLLVGATLFLLNGHSAMAAETVAATTATSEGLKYIGAALSTGIGAIGAGIAVGITGSAAIGAISEDPKLFGKSIIYVGLAEGIAIYGFIISIMILG